MVWTCSESEGNHVVRVKGTLANIILQGKVGGRRSGGLDM